MPHHEVMLIRCPPSSADAPSVRAALARPALGQRLLFFHGPGLQWASAAAADFRFLVEQPNTSLMLCSAGWRRRHGGEPPSGWQLGSLIQFWDAADAAEVVQSFGALT